MIFILISIFRHSGYCKLKFIQGDTLSYGISNRLFSSTFLSFSLFSIQEAE